MRLRSLAVDSYGNFERLRLAFDPRPGCINLVIAPNGAGKSVLRQALHDLLFEIGLQSPMRFRHGYPNMNLQAEAVACDGAPLVFGWSRKHKRTFGPGDGHQARLDAVLGHVTQQQARLLFSLDTAALREGGQELASGSGTLGAAMLSGTGELVSARAVRTALLQRRDGLWEKGRSSRPLNQAARAVTDARSLARDAVQAPRQRQAQTAEIVEYQRLRDQARAQLVVAQEQARRLARVDLTRPHLDDLATAELWLSENPAAPVLGEQLGDELAAARAAAVLATAKLADAQEAHGRARDAVAAITLDQAALDAAEELAPLPERLGQIEKAARDKVGLEGERREVGERMAALLRAIGTAIPLDQASALLPPVAILAQARALIQQEGALVAGLALARKRLRDAQTAHDALMGGPVAGPERSDAGELRRLLQDIRADRDPLRHAAGLAEALRQKQAAAAAALDRVAGWGGARHELNEGAAPSESRFARLGEACRTAQAAASEANARRDRKAAECHGWQQELDQLRVEDLPDEAALAAARARRDDGWRLIHHRAFPAGAPDPAAEVAYAGDEPLPLVFERDLRAADGVADRLIAELGRVKEASRLSRQLADGAAEHAALEDEAARTASVLRQALDEWVAACKLLALPGDATMADVRSALKSRMDAREAVQAEDAARADMQALGDAHAAWAVRLSRLLGAAAGKTLAELLADADASLAEAAVAEAAWSRRQALLEGAQQDLRTAQADLASAVDAQDGWQIQWAESLAALQRPVGESTAATAVVLDRLAELDRRVAEAAGLSNRISAMQQDGDAFAAAVRTLATRLGMAELGHPFETARALIQRAAAARERLSGWQQATQAAMAAEAKVRHAEDADRAARQTLSAVLAACGASDGPDAERRLLAARNRARHEQMRDTAEAALRRYGDGLPVAALRAEAALYPAESMAAERSAAEDAQTQASTTAESVAVNLSRLEDRAEADAGATVAIEAAHDQEAAVTRFAHLLDDYMLAHVAGSMLGRAMDVLEQGAGNAGLLRISEAFAITSGGTHTITGGEGPNGEATLLAIDRRFPHERCPIAALSEGLRDQLYLALRLVAIEDHVATAPALPFIADDILQTFDDERALASLNGLLALSRHVQVVVLTHHNHIAALAERMAPGTVHLQTLFEAVAA